MTKQGLFSGGVENTFTIQDLIDLYKIGWRSLEGITLHAKLWRTDRQLTIDALASIEGFLKQKAFGEGPFEVKSFTQEAWINHGQQAPVTLSIVPPGETSND